MSASPFTFSSGDSRLSGLASSCCCQVAILYRRVKKVQPSCCILGRGPRGWGHRGRRRRDGGPGMLDRLLLDSLFSESSCSIRDSQGLPLHTMASPIETARQDLLHLACHATPNASWDSSRRSQNHLSGSTTKYPMRPHLWLCEGHALNVPRGCQATAKRACTSHACDQRPPLHNALSGTCWNRRLASAQHVCSAPGLACSRSAPQALEDVP